MISDPNIRQLARLMVKFHEGRRLNQYTDDKGFPTIGYGHLLDSREISTLNNITIEQAERLYEKDFREHEMHAGRLPVFKKLDPVRQAVLVDMVYQMGITSVMGFRKMISALERQDWKKAYLECLDSRYHNTDTPGRARYNAAMLLTGYWWLMPFGHVNGLSDNENNELHSNWVAHSSTLPRDVLIENFQLT